MTLSRKSLLVIGDMRRLVAWKEVGGWDAVGEDARGLGGGVGRRAGGACMVGELCRTSSTR